MSLAKGSVYKILVGKCYSKPKGPFLTQLVRDVEVKEVVGKFSSDATQFEIPKADAIQESSIVLFKGPSDLTKFIATNDL